MALQILSAASVTQLVDALVTQLSSNHDGAPARDPFARDIVVAESFVASLQDELLDRHHWHDRVSLPLVMCHYVGGFYDRSRQQSGLGNLSPVDYEGAHATSSRHNTPRS